VFIINTRYNITLLHIIIILIKMTNCAFYEEIEIIHNQKRIKRCYLRHIFILKFLFYNSTDGEPSPSLAQSHYIPHTTTSD